MSRHSPYASLRHSVSLLRHGPFYRVERRQALVFENLSLFQDLCSMRLDPLPPTKIKQPSSVVLMPSRFIPERKKMVCFTVPRNIFLLICSLSMQFISTIQKAGLFYLEICFVSSSPMALDVIPENSAARSAAEDLVGALAAFQAIDDANPATAVARKVMLKQAVNAGVRILLNSCSEEPYPH